MAGDRNWAMTVAAAVLMAAAVGACAKTSQVENTITPATLATSAKAVAVMRLGAESPACRNLSVLLGTREPGGHFRHTRTANVVDVRSLTIPPVAEVELDPGEYHVVGFACGTGKGVKLVSGGHDRDIYRSSFASFSLAPGEIVNVGFLHMNATFYGRSALGRPVRVGMRISDWPVADLDRYKSSRPAIYQQMTTRLMIATPRTDAPDPSNCSKILALKAEGKLAAVPAFCLPARTARSP